MTVESGQYKHSVRIERLERQRDSAGRVIQDPQTGEVLTAWELVGRVWAKIEPLSAREFVQSASTQTEVTTRISFRQPDYDVLKTDRLVHESLRRGDTFYDVRGVLEDRDSGEEYLTLPCSRGVNNG